MKSSPRPVNDIENGIESQRATRLRDNKRRNRQRQKDYTSSLESRLKELQSQGVQATKEVQVSARKVVEENARLKALLRHTGVPDHVIETWKPMAAGEHRAEKALMSWETKAIRVSSPSTCNRKDQLITLDMDSAPLLTTKTEFMLEPASSSFEPSPSIPESNSKQCNGVQVKSQETTSKSTESSSLDNKVQLSPCKLLTRLAKDPGADVRQSSTEGWNAGDDETGGVECSKAHNMLMQFATTEEKLDVISHALEQGCVKKAGGGCKVRNEAIWKAIDDVM